MLASAVQPHDIVARHASGLLGMMLMALHCIAVVHMCGLCTQVVESSQLICCLVIISRPANVSVLP